MSRRKRERERFEEEALGHLDGLYRLALHLSGNEHDAEDLVQDTFLHAFRKSHQFRPGTHLKAWLFRIARNAHIDRVRRRIRERDALTVRSAAAEPGGGAEAARGSPESGQNGGAARWQGVVMEGERAFYDLFGDEVNRFLAELSPDFRLALLLCDIEGLSYEEIAQTLDCPVGTVRSRISRARGHLREKLRAYARDLGYAKELSAGDPKT
jgi:RNA polymerase sigma-70 factor (ECF subfamily)